MKRPYETPAFTLIVLTSSQLLAGSPTGLSIHETPSSSPQLSKETTYDTEDEDELPPAPAWGEVIW